MGESVDPYAIVEVEVDSETLENGWRQRGVSFEAAYTLGLGLKRSISNGDITIAYKQLVGLWKPTIDDVQKVVMYKYIPFYEANIHGWNIMHPFRTNDMLIECTKRVKTQEDFNQWIKVFVKDKVCRLHNVDKEYALPMSFTGITFMKDNVFMTEECLKEWWLCQ